MSLYRRIRSFGLQIVRTILSLIIPVNRNKIFFQSYPDYSDNARAMSDYLKKNTSYHIYWSVKDPSLYEGSERLTFIETNGGGTLRGRIQFIYHTVSSRYLFSTHMAFLYANKRKQSYICLWHGMPLKKIGLMQNNDSGNYLNNVSFFLCTTQYFVPIMAKSFGREETDILPLGLPRNDLLFQSNNSLEKLGIKKGDKTKIIVYLPTFRKTQNNNVNDSESDVFRNDVLSISSNEQLSYLNFLLKDLDIIMIIKPHPMDVNSLQYKNLSNVLIVPASVINEKDIQLYHLLHEADALITDFSSVYVDYLALNRPIGFMLNDLNDYANNRGFVFDNPLDYMPGKKIYNHADFQSFLADVSYGIDDYKQDRIKISAKLNNYSDSDNCKRLVEYLKL